MKNPSPKPAAKQHFSVSPHLQHPHYFEQLNDNLKMRYLTLKQRVNSNAAIPLDQKKKALDQASRGYLELRELAKELQYVCMKESVGESFTKSYELVITCQQLPLARIKQILSVLKGQLEDQSSFFHIICKEMQRRQETMRRMLGYLRKYQELANLQNAAFEQPVGQGMPILYDLMSKIVDRLIEFRDTTLCLLERLLDWKAHLRSIMSLEDEDEKQRILKDVHFELDSLNIIETLAKESMDLSKTPLSRFIPFKEECETDPLLLHPYKISALTDDRPLNRPPLVALFNLNRKYVQRLTRGQQFFVQQLESSRYRTHGPEELPEYKVYSQIFSQKFYRKAVRRNHSKQPEPPSFLHKRFDTDIEDDMLFPLIRSQLPSDSHQRMDSIKPPVTTIDTDKLDPPKPQARSRIRLKPALPSFKRHRTETEKLDEQLKEVISNYIRLKTQESALAEDSYSSRKQPQEIRAEIKRDTSRTKHPNTLAGGVVSLTVGGKPEKTPTEDPSPKKVLSLYKFEIMSYPNEGRGAKLPPIEKPSVDRLPTEPSANMVSEEVQTQSQKIPSQPPSPTQRKEVDIQISKEQIVLKEDSKLDGQHILQTSLESLQPVVSLPEPESEVIDQTGELQLSQILLHDWQLPDYVNSCRKKYYYNILEPSIAWDSYYVYELRAKQDQEAAAVIILRRVRAALKSYHVLKLVLLSSGSDELIAVILSKCKQKLQSYGSHSEIMVQAQRQRMQGWLAPALLEALFEADSENYVLTIRKPNHKEEVVKAPIQLQISGVMIKSDSPFRPNFSSEDVQAFSERNFIGEGIQACLAGESIRSSKSNVLEFKKSSGRELYFSQTVHSRKCKSLREINNFLEAYELETFEEPELGGGSKIAAEVVVCAVNESLSFPFSYATIPIERSTDGVLNYFIFNCTTSSVDLWSRETAAGLQQMCMIKLQRNMWMYVYKSDSEEELRRLPVYDSKFRQIGRRREQQYSKCLLEMFVKQLYGKLPIQQLGSDAVYGSLFVSVDEDDLTYNSIDYNITHKDMLYFYMPFVVGFCVDGDNQRYSLCEVVVDREPVTLNNSAN